MKLPGIGPAGQAGHDVELSKQPAHELIGVVLRAEMFELIQDSRDRGVGLGDGALGVVLALPREALAVPEKLLPVEVGQYVTGALEILPGLTKRAMRLLAWDYRGMDGSSVVKRRGSVNGL